MNGMVIGVIDYRIITITESDLVKSHSDKFFN